LPWGKESHRRSHPWRPVELVRIRELRTALKKEHPQSGSGKLHCPTKWTGGDPPRTREKHSPALVKACQSRSKRRRVTPGRNPTFTGRPEKLGMTGSEGNTCSEPPKETWQLLSAEYPIRTVEPENNGPLESPKPKGNRAQRVDGLRRKPMPAARSPRRLVELGNRIRRLGP
jgi:hypothetical protein